MSALEAKLKALIRAEGPIPLNVYMQICLHDPAHGYYATRNGLGKDFTTAPEISQIFGELIGLWCVHEWGQLGEPDPCLWIEAGPGRGVLAQDALRAMQVAPQCAKLMRPVLIELSPDLKKLQQQKLADFQDGLWVEALEQAPQGASLFIANEFLDCLPIRRYVRNHEQNWCEQRIGLDQEGNLKTGLSIPLPVSPLYAPPQANEWTVSPALNSLIEQLAERLQAYPSRALLIDYDSQAGQQNGLRAFADGECVSFLTRPGEIDLTANIDFDTVARLAQAKGLNVFGPVRQGQFLEMLGAKIRLQALSEQCPEQADALEAGLMRLLDMQDMGGRYGVMCLSSPNLPAPVGFACAEAASTDQSEGQPA